MPLPIDSRKTPTEVKVYVTSGEGVTITWSDDTQLAMRRHRSKEDTRRDVRITLG